MKRLPLICSVLAVVALSASLAYWFLQFYQPAQRPIAAPPSAAVIEPSMDAAGALFGGQQVAAAATNYQLTGVVAAGRDSVAILAVDGKPARAVKLGKEVEPGVTVQEVQPKYVMLAEAGVSKRVELQPDTKAGGGAAATLPPAPVPPPSTPNTTTIVTPGTPASSGPQPGAAPPPPAPMQMPPPTRGPGGPASAQQGQ